jgi:hypothetical protein
MRLPHNRLLYFLPLLLFGWRTPTLAAQTWTTVWTPGTPAVQAAAKNDTHESKTNCRPCEVWNIYKNSGQGGWDPLPPNSEPIRCHGDTNDYTCKVCDGKGVVINAANGTDCDIQMVLMETGKCCDGECLPVPQPGVDPCTWALDNKNLMSPADRSKLRCGSDTMGYVLCIFGEKYACTVPCNFPSSWGQDMKDCIMKEETNHLNSATAQCPPCIGMAKYPDGPTEKDEECAARAATFACMETLTNEASHWYKITIYRALVNIRQDMIDRGCPNIPPEPVYPEE